MKPNRESPSQPPAQLPSFIGVHPEGVRLAIKLQPRASASEIGGSIGDELKVKVTAPPVDSAANAALLELLAEKLDCAANRLQLIRGHTSRHKTVLVHGLTPAEIARKLLGHSGAR